MALPDALRPLFWSYDLDRMDPTTHKETIVVQVVNYGTLQQWRWLTEQYGREEVAAVLSRVPATALRPRARRLASLWFGVDQFNYAPRGTQALAKSAQSSHPLAASPTAQ